MKAVKRVMSRRNGETTSMEIVNRLRVHQLRIFDWRDGITIVVSGTPKAINDFKRDTGGWKKQRKRTRKVVPA